VLPAAALQRFVGEYPLAPDFVLAVWRDGDHLFAHAPGQPVVELFPDSPTTFFAPVAGAQIEFQTDTSGEVTGLALLQYGRRVSATKHVATLPAVRARTR
jgi:hypothetical protein